MATRCSGCTLLSEFDEAFVKSGEDFAGRWELLCPACAAHWRYRRLMWAHVSGVLAGLAGSLLVVSGLAPVLGWIFVHMGLVVVLRWLLRALAQVGHAAAAWVLGFRILRIVIGEGRSEIEFALGDVSITLRPLIGWSGMSWYPRGSGLVRCRCVLALAMGPAFVIGLEALALYLAGPFESPIGVAWRVLTALVALELVLSETRSGRTLSRALEFLVGPLPFGPESGWTEAANGREILRRGRAGDALAWFDRAVSIAPDDPSHRIPRSSALLELGRYEEALSDLERAAATSEDPRDRGLILNNIAWAIVAGDLPRLDRADEASTRAYALEPWASEIRGTRGCVLLLTGREAAGREMIEEAWQAHESNESRAALDAILARHEARAGRPEAAQALFERARNVDPGSALLRNVERAISTA